MKEQDAKEERDQLEVELSSCSNPKRDATDLLFGLVRSLVDDNIVLGPG